MTTATCALINNSAQPLSSGQQLAQCLMGNHCPIPRISLALSASNTSSCGTGFGTWLWRCSGLSEHHTFAHTPQLRKGESNGPKTGGPALSGVSRLSKPHDTTPPSARVSNSRRCLGWFAFMRTRGGVSGFQNKTSYQALRQQIWLLDLTHLRSSEIWSLNFAAGNSPTPIPSHPIPFPSHSILAFSHPIPQSQL